MVQKLDGGLIFSPWLTLICNYKANERNSEKVDGPKGLGFYLA